MFIYCVSMNEAYCAAMRNLAANTPCRKSAVFGSSMFLICMELKLGAVYTKGQAAKLPMETVQSRGAQGSLRLRFKENICRHKTISR